MAPPEPAPAPAAVLEDGVGKTRLGDTGRGSPETERPTSSLPSPLPRLPQATDISPGACSRAHLCSPRPMPLPTQHQEDPWPEGVASRALQQIKPQSPAGGLLPEPPTAAEPLTAGQVMSSCRSRRLAQDGAALTVDFLEQDHRRNSPRVPQALTEPLSPQRDVQDEESAVHYLLLGAPGPCSAVGAEDLRLQLPLQELPSQASNWLASPLEQLGISNILLEEVPDVSPESYSCQFTASKLSRVLGSGDLDAFFPRTRKAPHCEQGPALFEILAKTPYGHEKKGLLGIDQLLGQAVFSAALPLHDVNPGAGGAQLGCGGRLRLPPEVLYTGWLLPAAVVGTLVWCSWRAVSWCSQAHLHKCPLPSAPRPSRCLLRQELCGSGDSFETCLLCHDCPFWLLSSTCALVQARGGQACSWCCGPCPPGMLECKSIMQAHPWGCSNREDIEVGGPLALMERSPPLSTGFPPGEAVASGGRLSSHNSPEPHRWVLGCRDSSTAAQASGCPQVAMVVMCLVSVILYRAILAILVSRSNNTLLAAWSSCIASLMGSILNLVFTLILSKTYVALAHVLTKWEMHRTQTKFEDAFPLKVFINFCCSLVCIAFCKGSVWLGGCLTELAQELLVITVGKQIINNVQEILRCSAAASPSSWPPPAPPLFAPLNNWVDALRFVCERGVWVHVLAGVTHLAVTGNPHIPCRCQAFREDEGHRSPAICLAFVIVCEHVVSSTSRVLDLVVPDIPESVEIEVKWECYLAEQALAESEVSAGPSLAPCCHPKGVRSLSNHSPPPLPFPGNRLFLDQTEVKWTSPQAQRSCGSPQGQLTTAAPPEGWGTPCPGGTGAPPWPWKVGTLEPTGLTSFLGPHDHGPPYSVLHSRTVLAAALGSPSEDDQ
ncbi:Anoctamin-7 [Camelus dromedarius]|uniref:Anoctamin n=1 Tax=Camelus dromedarius TaxID=9838 RepID=A0A5N4E5Z4_CAMDR|nr:Anoctamin-7 [Camelus dromedarius]